jgi:hypothetical protein
VWGAAEALREQTGLYNGPTFSFHEQLLAPALAGEAAPLLSAARTAGRLLSQEDAVALALSEPAAPASAGATAAPAHARPVEETAAAAAGSARPPAADR